ncbi:MAG: ArsA family ATPase [Methylococcaceae bacterium]
MNPTVFPDFLQASALKLVFFGGKGGVGKSTCATTTALKLARDYPQHQFLLMSTDPAHSLHNILCSVSLPSNLTIRELDAAAALQEFKSLHDEQLKEIAERGTFLDSDDVQGLMDAALPGMDELAAYLKIAQWLEQDNYYRIIVDTAPTGHTLRLLEMPQLIHRWLIALDSLLAKHRYMRGRFGGNNHLDHLDHFLLDMNDALKNMQTLLHDAQRCRFILVMLAEALSVAESLMLAKALQEKQIALCDVLVNQIVPENDCVACMTERNQQVFAIKKALNHLPEVTFWGLPLLAIEPRAKILETFYTQAVKLDENILLNSYCDYILPLQVRDPLLLPADSLRLLIFAGKGGVGKTTLACATALRLHNDYPHLRILLFSTDPAHSLSDCLGLKIHTQPTSVLFKVDAQEINAQADFEKIRHDYRTELEAFLLNALPHLDITFDREVMEHLLDLAPAGLDEIMALTSIMTYLDQNRYDMIIIDAAPSGHLLRLLELPEVIQEWLKLFFSLLLKYRQVLHLPHLSERLVQLSRELKKLRLLLHDNQQTSLYAVSIATHLAIEKTYEMSLSLRNLGISPKALFINQLTPASGCALCQALIEREALQLKRSHDIFPDLPQTRIFRQTAPVGVNELIALGTAMFS